MVVVTVAVSLAAPKLIFCCSWMVFFIYLFMKNALSYNVACKQWCNDSAYDLLLWLSRIQDGVCIFIIWEIYTCSLGFFFLVYLLYFLIYIFSQQNF